MNEEKNIKEPTKKAWSIAFVSGSCYRVVTDRFLGYEVQQKKRFLFWTWWEQVNFTNTHSTLEDAKEYIKKGCPKREHSEKQKVVWVSDNCH